MIILFGVLGGIHIFGFPGIIIGPTIISLAFAELEIYKAFIKK
jgi:predicted PurR-regulated permease PerM